MVDAVEKDGVVRLVEPRKRDSESATDPNRRFSNAKTFSRGREGNKYKDKSVTITGAPKA